MISTWYTVVTSNCQIVVLDSSAPTALHSNQYPTTQNEVIYNIEYSRNIVTVTSPQYTIFSAERFQLQLFVSSLISWRSARFLRKQWLLWCPALPCCLLPATRNLLTHRTAYFMTGNASKDRNRWWGKMRRYTINMGELNAWEVEWEMHWRMMLCENVWKDAWAILLGWKKVCRRDHGRIDILDNVWALN